MAFFWYEDHEAVLSQFLQPPLHLVRDEIVVVVSHIRSGSRLRHCVQGELLRGQLFSVLIWAFFTSFNLPTRLGNLGLRNSIKSVEELVDSEAKNPNRSPLVRQTHSRRRRERATRTRKPKSTRDKRNKKKQEEIARDPEIRSAIGPAAHQTKNGTQDGDQLQLPEGPKRPKIHHRIGDEGKERTSGVRGLGKRKWRPAPGTLGKSGGQHGGLGNIVNSSGGGKTI
ncbi:hypothetical protein BHE74_00004254 [Ensete ventricosum]|nr:hypothetical protein BHE74_00004254 [Ensete ventricosum]